MRLLTATGVALFLSGLLALVWTYELNPPDFSVNLLNPIVLIMAVGTIVPGFVSLGLGRRAIPRARVRIIATAFLIIALLVPATFFYAEQTAVVGCLCTGTSPGYYLSGTITVPLETGNGTLTVEVHNDKVNDISITAVTFTTLTLPSSSGVDNNPAIDNISGLVVTSYGKSISQTNPLLPGEAATGTIGIANVTAGTTYQVNTVITFGNAGQAYEALSISAQV